MDEDRPDTSRRPAVRRDGLMAYLNRYSLTSPVGCATVLVAATIGAALGVWVTWEDPKPPRPVDSAELTSLRIILPDAPPRPVNDAGIRRRWAQAIAAAQAVDAPAGDAMWGQVETIDSAGRQERYIIRGSDLVEVRGRLLRLKQPVGQLLGEAGLQE